MGKRVVVVLEGGVAEKLLEVAWATGRRVDAVVRGLLGRLVFEYGVDWVSAYLLGLEDLEATIERLRRELRECREQLSATKYSSPAEPAGDACEILAAEIRARGLADAARRLLLEPGDPGPLDYFSDDAVWAIKQCGRRLLGLLGDQHDTGRRVKQRLEWII